MRIILTVMVMMLHAAITYGGPGGWFVQEVQTSSLDPLTLLLFLMFNAGSQAMTMALFFLIAGNFTGASLERKGASAFLRDRLLRLGLPLAFFVFVGAQLTGAMANWTRGYGFGHTLSKLYLTCEYNPGPLWFLQALLLFSVAWIMWRRFRPGCKPTTSDAPKALPSHAAIAIALLLVGCANFLVRLVAPVGWSILGFQLAYFPVYFLMFFHGCRHSGDRMLERIDRRFALPWMILSFVLLPLLPLVASQCRDINQFAGGPNAFSLFYCFWDPFFGFGANIALLWFMRTRFNSGTRLTIMLGRGSYLAYCLHATVLVGLSAALMSWHAHPLVKWTTVGSLCVFTCYAFALLAAKLPLFRRLC